MRVLLLAAGRDDALREQAAALRTAVFVGEQGVDPAVEADALDHAPTTVHAVAVDDERVLATGRLLDPVPDLAEGRVGRMAVARAARGGGVGLALLRALEEASRARGQLGVQLHAQAPAIGFYDRAGYSPMGARFLEQGIEHLRMTRAWLPGLRPVTDDDAAAVQALIGGCFEEYDGCVLDLADLDAWMLRPSCRRLWVVPAPGGTLEACVGVGGDGSDARTLTSLYVAAPARRRGWGSVLVHLAERAGARQLWTDTRFLDAHRLYARLGWRDTGERRELHDPSATTEARWVLPAAAAGPARGAAPVAGAA